MVQDHGLHQLLFLYVNLLLTVYVPFFIFDRQKTKIFHSQKRVYRRAKRGAEQPKKHQKRSPNLAKEQNLSTPIVPKQQNSNKRAISVFGATRLFNQPIVPIYRFLI